MNEEAQEPGQVRIRFFDKIPIGDIFTYTDGSELVVDRALADELIRCGAAVIVSGGNRR